MDCIYPTQRSSWYLDSAINMGFCKHGKVLVTHVSFFLQIKNVCEPYVFPRLSVWYVSISCFRRHLIQISTSAWVLQDLWLISYHVAVLCNMGFIFLVCFGPSVALEIGSIYPTLHSKPCSNRICLYNVSASVPIKIKRTVEIPLSSTFCKNNLCIVYGWKIAYPVEKY